MKIVFFYLQRGAIFASIKYKKMSNKVKNIKDWMISRS